MSRTKTPGINFRDALIAVVARRMRECGVNRPTLAWASGMRPDYLSLCFRGVRPFSGKVLAKIASHLNSTVAEIERAASELTCRAY